MFDAALASWVGAPPAMCIFGETCGNAVALEHNGDVYSCDHFVEPSYLLGNIPQTHMLRAGRLAGSSGRSARQARHAAAVLPRVQRALRLPRRVPEEPLHATPDGEPGLNYLCAGYKAFFTHIDGPMRTMADLLRQGRYADEAMNLLAATECS